MAELLSMHGWPYPSIRTETTSSDPREARAPSKLRSLAFHKTVFRAKSTNALSDMVDGSNKAKSSSFVDESETSLNTLRDPRIASTTDLSNTASSSPRHPDLSNEVAALSDKLIQAINNQTVLDDTLAATRQELELSRERMLQMEEENKRYREDISTGILVRRDEVEFEKTEIRKQLEEEKIRRITVEKEKKGIEQELADLTAALFEEANKMVAAAKKEREAVEKRNEQLHAQIKDTETLLASHQEQLAELKSVMQHMNSDREDSDIRTNPSTAPASPAAIQSQGNLSRLLEAMNLSPTTPGSGDISPAPSTSFSHLIKSVCRTDIQAYEDFRALLHQSKSSRPPSRAVSGSYAGLNVMGLTSLTGNYSSPQHQYRSSAPANSSAGSAVNSPSNSTPISPRQPTSFTPLRDTKFYKRVMTEDIEPTLRLDIAPGISWLTRRSVVSSICDGGLVIEPIPAAAVKYSPPCALCGEKRSANEHARRHRFRTSDSDSAQRHPLCILCLEKMRSCCDFVTYLRLIVDGHVRIGDEEDEKEAWEETVRLRERMFWSRMGGGVVPAFIPTDSPEKDPSVKSVGSPLPKKSYGSLKDGVQTISLPKRGVNQATGNERSLDDPFVSDPNATSVGHTIITRQESPPLEKADEPAANNDESTSSVIKTKHANTRDSLSAENSVALSNSDSSLLTTSKGTNVFEPRLKVTIPTAF
ncbi:rab guanine nucleotide exchange factor S2 [Emydomyces testavorans]|uniref:Rab guanine nucleotide exchange factor S2 n=1 Tax=Emydomyces testavorans TaxID=2070801 RepID=A0AAF0DGU8_9EURO|nr:rab guanine nucleotide exchange factor S2 [Emydomyces testavorans]